jgi:hypothetical protein
MQNVAGPLVRRTSRGYPALCGNRVPEAAQAHRATPNRKSAHPNGRKGFSHSTFRPDNTCRAIFPRLLQLNVECDRSETICVPSDRRSTSYRCLFDQVSRSKLLKLPRSCGVAQFRFRHVGLIEADHMRRGRNQTRWLMNQSLMFEGEGKRLPSPG